MQGNTDLIRFLQTAMGYALSGDTKQECMFMFYGPLSRNGKSTTLDTFINLLGGYAAAMKSETIGIKTFNNSGGPSEDIARLNGVRAAGASEIERNMGFNAPLIKQMTGNNILTARFLRENSFSFKPQFKLFMDTNYLPVINDETLFRSGRIVVIPFNRYFEESEQDNNLKAFFESPENMSGILNWLIEGFNRYEAEGLQRPEIIKKAIEEYHQKSNNALTFIFQCLKIHQGSTLSSIQIYTRYKRWCFDNNLKPVNTNEFVRTMKNQGFTFRRSRIENEKNPITLAENVTWADAQENEYL